jgi:hypothetical protein
MAMMMEYDQGVRDARLKGRPDLLMKWSQPYKDGYESVRGFGSFDQDMNAPLERDDPYPP